MPGSAWIDALVDHVNEEAEEEAAMNMQLEGINEKDAREIAHKHRDSEVKAKRNRNGTVNVSITSKGGSSIKDVVTGPNGLVCMTVDGVTTTTTGSSAMEQLKQRGSYGRAPEVGAPLAHAAMKPSTWHRRWWHYLKRHVGLLQTGRQRSGIDIVTAYRSAPKVPASLATAMTHKSTWERRMAHYYRRTAQCRPAVYFIMGLAALGTGLSSLPSTFARFMGLLCGLTATMSWLVIGATLLRLRMMRRPMIVSLPPMSEWKTDLASQEPIAMSPHELQEARDRAVAHRLY